MGTSVHHVSELEHCDHFFFPFFFWKSDCGALLASVRHAKDVLLTNILVALSPIVGLFFFFFGEAAPLLSSMVFDQNMGVFVQLPKQLVDT